MILISADRKKFSLFYGYFCRIYVFTQLVTSYNYGALIHSQILTRRDALLVLYFGLHLRYSLTPIHLERDQLIRQSYDKNLHRLVAGNTKCGPEVLLAGYAALICIGLHWALWRSSSKPNLIRKL